MVDIHTKPSLLRALESAARRKPTVDEVKKQRVSFVMSAVKENRELTKARIEEILAEQEGGELA